MNSFKQKLNAIGNSYLEDSPDYNQLKETTDNFKELLFSWYQKKFGENLDRENIENENGTAIGPLWAAMCLEDIARTKKFICGIAKAIEQNRNKKSPIKIIYAGTGPFATLLLPLFKKFEDLNIEYTLLELNPISFSVLSRLLKDLDFSNLKISLIEADATKFKLSLNQFPDVCISETMQNSLDKEHQVAIFQNFFEQSKPKTIFIPEKIELFIAKRAYNNSSLSMRAQKIQKVYELSRQSFIKTGKEFPVVKTTISKNELDENEDLVLLTIIHVFQEEKILENESGLTIPKTIFRQPIKSEFVIYSQYEIGANPKLNLNFSIPN